MRYNSLLTRIVMSDLYSNTRKFYNIMENSVYKYILLIF